MYAKLLVILYASSEHIICRLLNLVASQNSWWQQQQSQQQSRSPQQHFSHILENFTYSAKHAGLYLYIGRLLRPLWKKKCIITPQCQSSIAPQDCSEILDELYALKAFLEGLPDKNQSGKFKITKCLSFSRLIENETENKNLTGFLHNNSIIGVSNGYGHSNAASSQQNAYAEEKQSVHALLLLISE